MPIQNAILHLLSAAVIALTGVGVILWALMSWPQVRWDRFRIGLALLLLVAPVAAIVAAVRLGNAIEEANAPEGDLAGEITDTIGTTWVGRHDLPLIDSTTSDPLGVPFTTGDGTPSAAHEDQTGR